VNWLMLDTACPHAVVAIANDRGVLAEVYLDETLKHGERFPGAVATCLHDASVHVEQIGGVVVGQGPGSFVGVRIAMAYAKGFCVARQIPLVGVCTLSAMAAGPKLAFGKGFSFIDARRGEFYVRELERKLVDGAVHILPFTEPMTKAPADLRLPDAGALVGGWMLGQDVTPMRGPSAHGLWVMLQQRLSSLAAGETLDDKFDLTPSYARSPDAKLWT
jgi:tRNA threonylcarbamoyladenosine biosynthesis protein TsaB